eukprot:scaffold89742_cov75-Phaeocystis_antarctica.AAC.1
MLYPSSATGLLAMEGLLRRQSGQGWNWSFPPNALTSTLVCVCFPVSTLIVKDGDLSPWGDPRSKSGAIGAQILKSSKGRRRRSALKCSKGGFDAASTVSNVHALQVTECLAPIGIPLQAQHT